MSLKDQVPDYIEPIKAVRLFRLERGRLFSVVKAAEAWHPGVNYAECCEIPSEWEMDDLERLAYSRRCEDLNLTPEKWLLSHNCGFYAGESLTGLARALGQHFLKSLLKYQTRHGSNYVLGKVELSGAVVQGTRGFRATRAKIQHIEIHRESRLSQWETEELAKRYQVKVDFERLDPLRRLLSILVMEALLWTSYWEDKTE